jgi:hypothetical protein
MKERTMPDVFTASDNAFGHHVVTAARSSSGTNTPLSQLVQQPTSLPPGTYTLEWMYSGNPGQKEQVTVYERVASGWRAFAPPLVLQMPLGQGQMSSQTPPNGYKPYTFTV